MNEPVSPPLFPEDAPKGVRKPPASKTVSAASKAAPKGPKDDAPYRPATCEVSLPAFEGPLDLLLHLCQKHELDILDIPIRFVTEKYLEYLALMQLLDLDVAAEYLLMAATLAHIKSKMLLPTPPVGQDDDLLLEEEDPREALIRRLLEYQKYKHAGAELESRGVTGRDVFLRGMTVEDATPPAIAPLKGLSLVALLDAFQAILARKQVEFTHDIVADQISLNDRVEQVLSVLEVKKRVPFEALFERFATTFDLVITLLALLEMTKLRLVTLSQSKPLATIYIDLGDDDARREVRESGFFQKPFAVTSVRVESVSEGPSS